MKDIKELRKECYQLYKSRSSLGVEEYNSRQHSLVEEYNKALLEVGDFVDGVLTPKIKGVIPEELFMLPDYMQKFDGIILKKVEKIYIKKDVSVISKNAFRGLNCAKEIEFEPREERLEIYDGAFSEQKDGVVVQTKTTNLPSDLYVYTAKGENSYPAFDGRLLTGIELSQLNKYQVEHGEYNFTLSDFEDFRLEFVMKLSEELGSN
jgi:hypothetical protein